ncbi:integrase, catalytic region, zinc finger, CCHC-type containing protein [Tanacetum coccineum]
MWMTSWNTDERCIDSTSALPILHMVVGRVLVEIKRYSIFGLNICTRLTEDKEIALNVDNEFQADDCDAFDVDSVPIRATTEMLFVKIRSTRDDDDYVKDNAVPVVQSNESSIPIDAYMMVLNDIYEPSTQCVSVTTQNNVVEYSLSAELATYKEQVKLYERRAKFKLIEREQKINEQLRIVIDDRNLKEANLKMELHSVKLQLASTINYNKSMVEEVTSLKKDFKQKENKYLEEFLDMKALKEKVEDKLYKQDQSLQTVHMLPTPYVMNKIRNNREVHLDYLKHLKESVETLREIVEEAKVERPLDSSLAFACLYTKHSQELKKKVTFEDQCEMSNSNTHKSVEKLYIQKTNVSVPPSARVNNCTNASGSQPRSNTKKNRIFPAKSVNKKQVEEHPRTNKSSLKTTNRVDSSISSKLKQIWIPKQVWKATGKVLTSVGYQWRPTGRIFTLREQRPLTRLTKPKVMPATQTENVVQIVLWYLDSGCSKHMTGDRSRLRNFMKKFIRTVRFGNDHFGAIIGYGDYMIGDSVFSRVYYVEGLGRNLFSVGQFYESELEVAFRKHSCYVRNTDGVELIKVGLNKTIRYIRTENGTEYVNKDLTEYYESVTIFHQKIVLRTPQQNGVVKRQNRTLVEVARSMLIFSKASMFLWAEVVATACYTQNRSLIHTRHNKTPYELVHDKKPNLTFFIVFGAFCYPTNNSEDLGKLQPTADIGIFIGYAPSRKGYRIYNKRTRRIMGTIHVQFNELSEPMAPMQQQYTGSELLSDAWTDKLQGFNPSCSVATLCNPRGARGGGCGGAGVLGGSRYELLGCR